MLRGFLHPDFTGVVDQFRRLLPASDGGASLAILHRGEVVVEVAGGTRDASGAPFLTDTVALSFSTTTGVASTLVHILASQGRIDYDAPVATYWPAFGQNGKETITVRDVLCHEAGLFSIRALVDDASEMLDWAGMLRRIEQARPAHAPGESRAYHAVTYGWLVGGLIEKVTGKPFAEVLRDELAMPLGLRGCFVGLPRDEMHRRAHLFGAGAKRPDAKAPGAPPRRRARTRAAKLGSALRTAAFKLVGGDPASFKEALMPRGIANVDWNDEATLAACIPAANGAFDARSLARMYAMLANGGELDGVRLLSPRTLAMMRVNHLPGDQDLTQRAVDSFSETLHQGVGFGLGFATTLSEARAGVPGGGDFYWGGLAGTVFWVDPREDLVAIFMTQLTPSRAYNLRGVMKSVVYGALVD